MKVVGPYWLTQNHLQKPRFEANLNKTIKTQYLLEEPCYTKIMTKDVKPSAVDFCCGSDGCNSDGSDCIYKKKNSNPEFQIKISTTYITTSKPVSSNNELNDTKEQDQDTVINIDEIRPKALTSQKRTEKS